MRESILETISIRTYSNLVSRIYVEKVHITFTHKRLLNLRLYKKYWMSIFWICKCFIWKENVCTIWLWLLLNPEFLLWFQFMIFSIYVILDKCFFFEIILWWLDFSLHAYKYRTNLPNTYERFHFEKMKNI